MFKAASAVSHWLLLSELLLFGKIKILKALCKKVMVALMKLSVDIRVEPDTL